jgi:uncharacterized protein
VANRLAESTSPYLLQHAGNPVDWQPWGDEAFELARQRGVPVLLSIGYAACHWCHVMAHESFEDAATAAEMNEQFVNVKVDREERPDVDAVYMTATQALTGQGGWPMTVFLTPQGRPFYAGTYFPPQPRHGMASFRQVLAAVAQAWQQRRDEVESAGARIADALSSRSLPRAEQPPDAGTLAAAVRLLAEAEDRQYGGFGAAPKFPPSMTCEFLLRHAARDRTAAGAAVPGSTAELAGELAGRTLTAMARSGMYDQVAGGFARYSVDAAWVVPHFEKMLYDNAQLARVYLHWWRLTGEPTGARIAAETCDWMIAALGTEQGGFASSLDADTPVPDEHGRLHGEEGFSYVWTPAQLVEALGQQDGRWAADLLRVTERGSFEHGTSTLQLARDVWAEPSEAARWTGLRDVLARVRADRPQPGRDDKVVAAWNGLAIAALAETGALLGRPDLIRAAERAADLLLDTHLVDGRLRRVSRDGRVGTPAGVLEDHADLAEGLLALHCVTGAAGWLRAAGRLLDLVLDRFGAADGTLYDTADDGTDAELGIRPQDPTDNAYPSGRSAAAGALLGYAALTGSDRHRVAAEQALGVAAAVAGSAPSAVGWALAVAEALLDGPREVAVVSVDPVESVQLHRIALASPAPGCVVSAGRPDAEGLPLLAGRPAVGGRPTAYVCRRFVCDAPVTAPEQLAGSLGSRL